MKKPKAHSCWFALLAALVGCSTKPASAPDATRPPAMARVEIVSTPSGAAVFLDRDHRLGYTPLVLERPAMTRMEVLVVKDGYSPRRASFLVEGTRGQRVQVLLARSQGSLYFATDPFALDMVCQREVVAKRREMGREVNEHPRYTDYLRYAEKLGLGIADPDKIKLVAGIGMMRALTCWLLVVFGWDARPGRSPDDALLPPDGFRQAWERSGAATVFTSADLYGYIDGGAEIFFEFGFEWLTVQSYARSAPPAEEARVRFKAEVYRMADPFAATGIYLLKCGRETPDRSFRERHTVNKYQLLFKRDRYYVIKRRGKI